MKLNFNLWNDPVHGLIKITSDDEIIYQLLNAPEFKRLHFIKQLGHMYDVFPSCTHSRFLHMLGCYYLASQITDVYIPHYFSTYERMLVLVSALLHDLGHGPFSHTFEFVFNSNHEQKTQDIILSKSTTINKILSSYDSKFPSDVCAVLNDSYPNKVFHQLISSQIDVDRLDYLLRDGFFSGTKYATINVDWILKSLNISEDQKVVFDFQSLFAIEQYLLARYYMYHQLYLHPRSLAKDVLMRKIFLRYFELNSREYKFKFCYGLLPKLSHCDKLMIAEYLQLNDSLIYCWIQQLGKEEDLTLQKLVSYYNGTDSFYYYNINQANEASNNVVNQIKAKLKQLNYDEKYFYDYYAVDSVTAYSSFTSNAKSILVYDEARNVNKFEDLSSFSSNIHDIFKDFAFIFAPVKLDIPLCKSINE